MAGEVDGLDRVEGGGLGWREVGSSCYCMVWYILHYFQQKRAPLHDFFGNSPEYGRVGLLYACAAREIT